MGEMHRANVRELAERNRERFTATVVIAAAITSINTAAGHLSDALEQYQNLNNGSFSRLNTMHNALSGSESWTNPDRTAALAKLNQALDAYSLEAAKIVSGKPNVSEDEVKQIRAHLNPNMPPEAFNAAAQESANLIKSGADSLVQIYQNGIRTGVPPPTLKPFNDSTLKAFGNLGVDLAGTQQAAFGAQAGPQQGGKTVTQQYVQAAATKLRKSPQEVVQMLQQQGFQVAQ